MILRQSAKIISLRILKGKKARSNKTPALTKSTNMGIWVVGTSNISIIKSTP